MSDMLHNECTMWNYFSYSKIKNSKSGENKEHRDMLKKRFSDFSNVSGKIIWHLIKSAYHLVLFSALVMQEFTEYENLCLLSHSANLIPVKKGKINLTSWLVFLLSKFHLVNSIFFFFSSLLSPINSSNFEYLFIISLL